LGGVGVVAGRKDDDVDGGAIGAGRRMEPTHS
jgi:hypothetical protein